MSQMIDLGLDDSDRIIIPTSLQFRLGLSPGMMLVVEESESGGLCLRVQAESPDSVLVEKRGLLVARVQPLTDSDLTNITHIERERRVSELLERVGL